MLNLVKPQRLGRRAALMARFISAKPYESTTKLSDVNDPERSKFFAYAWGSWLRNDKIERAKRQTKFSIEGLTLLVNTLYEQQTNASNVDGSGEMLVKDPVSIKDSTILTNNLSKPLLGERAVLTAIASIHEGKHHRVYKLSLANEKELVLRIPYKLESEAAISRKIQSEVATLDFADLKLGLKVPKVYSYGTNKLNVIGSPYVLMEYIPGELLMKAWDPLVADDTPNATEKLKEVIDPIFEFYNKATSVVFNKFGSLYFRKDVADEFKNELPYAETDSLLKDRWRIGPSVEKSFSMNKNKLSEKTINQFNGPWNKNEPQKLIESLVELELENARNSLVILNANTQTDQLEAVNKQIKTLENLKKLAPKMLNPESKSIKNVHELFQPRLFIPDLDPLNVIISSKDNKPYFFDFEHASIKPVFLMTYPNFVAYDETKIYDLEQDVPEFETLDDVDKEQYKFMYYKTRNERLWEVELHKNRPELIALASPFVKLLKSPYTQALRLKRDKDYLYVDNAIIKLTDLWEMFVANELVNTKDPKFPVEYDDEALETIQKNLMDHQVQMSTTPFAATDGWVPQDMFSQLVEHEILKPDGENWKLDTDKVLSHSE